MSPVRPGLVGRIISLLLVAYVHVGALRAETYIDDGLTGAPSGR